MQDVIVPVGGNKSRHRFSSIQEMVDWCSLNGAKGNIMYYLCEAIQYNLEYRNYLRENGFQALVEKLNSETPYLQRNRLSLEHLEKWWKEIEENGGLGDYDIQCFGLDDTFTVFGKDVNGLKGLKSIVCGAIKASPCTGKKPPVVSDNNESGEECSSLYAALLWDPYPRFDISDYDDDREYQCYYIRKHKIYPGFFPDDEPGMQSVGEDIPISNLPIVYYDGDSPVMYVMTPRNS